MQKTKTESSRFTDLSFPNTDRQKDWISITILKRKSNGIKNNGIKEVEDKHPVEVKTSKFKEFYDKSKGKLKQAFDKLKEIFGKDKQVDISKENDDERE